jgi:hypothetical protein
MSDTDYSDNEEIQQIKALLQQKREQIKKEKEHKKLYEDVKAHFEDTHFKLLHPISYVEFNKTTNKIIIRNKTDFYNAYENLHYDGIDKKGKPIVGDFIKKWLKDDDILTYKFMDFLPCQKSPMGIFNTFKHFEVEKVPRTMGYDFVNDEYEPLYNSSIYKHLFNLCGKNDDVFTYVKMWLSRKIKKPFDLTKTALIFKSTQGTGKDLFFDWFGKSIIGSDYYHNDEKTELLFGRFNGIIQNKILIVINEASGKDTFQINENIKNAITRTINAIEIKGKEVFENTNNIGYVFLTNNDNALNISLEDRRFVAIKCCNDYANNSEYFKNIIDEITSKKYDRFFYDYLRSLDSDNYDFTNNRPKTDLYEDMKELNKSAIIYFLEDLVIKNNKYIEANEIKQYKSNTLFSAFNDYIKENNFRYEINNIKFGYELKKIDCIEKKRLNTGMSYNFDFKKLKEYLIEKGYIKPFDNDTIEI